MPQSTDEFSTWTWSQAEPVLQELADRPLDADNLEAWLAEWSHTCALLEETLARSQIAAAVDTADPDAAAHLEAFQENTYTPAAAANQRIREHLLAGDLEPPAGFEIPMRDMRVQAALFCEENLPLLSEEQELINAYFQIVGAQTAEWEGEQVTLVALEAKLEDPDRETRERVWRLRAERQLADREAIHALWAKLVPLRHQMALNAGFQDYCAFRWQQLRRYDYTPDDCVRLHQAIATVAGPAVGRIYERYRRGLDVPTLRPWDLETDPSGGAPLRPFEDVHELERKAGIVFDRIDPQLGAHFDLMRRERLLDLGNRKNKAPHAWCQTLPMTRRAFIFLNAVGWQRDLWMLFHEAGHAFHVFEASELPYYQQLEAPAEFLEVASMAMELLAAPYLAVGEDAFYSAADGARARIKHLEDAIIVSWPYCGAMDAFQHWVYTHPDDAVDGAVCDAKWAETWLDFMPGVDWDGLDDELAAGWQTMPHFFGWPLSGIEYAIAQLGAVQIWRNALRDPVDALVRYRQALSLGCTRPLPELYAAAGAKLTFDSEAMDEVVSLMERTIATLGDELVVERRSES